MSFRPRLEDAGDLRIRALLKCGLFHLASPDGGEDAC